MVTREDIVLQREQCQEDVLCVLDGLEDDVLDRVCQVIVDRFNVLLRKV